MWNANSLDLNESHRVHLPRLYSLLHHKRFLHIYIYIYMCVCVCVCVFMFVWVCVWSQVWVFEHVRVHVCMQLCACLRVEYVKEWGVGVVTVTDAENKSGEPNSNSVWDWSYFAFRYESSIIMSWYFATNLGKGQFLIPMLKITNIKSTWYQEIV